jgi:hypothetical protein
MRLCFFIAATVAAAFPVRAGDLWRAQDHHECDLICEWVRDLKVPGTREAGNPQSCCGEGDRYEADNFERDGDQYVAVVTDGHGIVPNGTKVIIPNSRVNWRDGNPTGRGQVFLSQRHDDGTYFVYCYAPPGGV